MEKREGVVWLASYPKSGNTWLRCLLEAYRRGGILDINDIRISASDGNASMIQGVSPVPLAGLGFRGEMLIRPCALLNLFARLSRPTWVKTHFANIQPDGLPQCIPAELTERAVYVVRDPRSVVTSFARFYKFPIGTACDAMSSKDFTIGGNEVFARTLLSTWSNHVASWVGEKVFPVHLVRYEDMLEDPARELTEVLEFMGIEPDAVMVKKAADAAAIRNVQKAETEKGFIENSGKNPSRFFDSGGVRWRQELGPRWIGRIESDHADVMGQLGYL